MPKGSEVEEVVKEEVLTNSRWYVTLHVKKSARDIFQVARGRKGFWGIWSLL